MNTAIKFFSLFVVISIFSCQRLPSRINQFETGCVDDSVAYNRLPVRLSDRGITASLPSAVSLKSFCPTPQNQGGFSTCTAWATTYAARTILLAKQNAWTDRLQITSEALNPAFIYERIKCVCYTNPPCNCDDKGMDTKKCGGGTYVIAALNTLQEEGASKWNFQPFSCPKNISDSEKHEAQTFRTGGFNRLYDKNDDVETNAMRIKSSLFEGKPIVISAKVYESVFKLRSDIWDANTAGSSFGHAMCLVGYDDNKYGGAFEIMNSWGEGWGNKGFFWVKYIDFFKETFIREVYNLENSTCPEVAEINNLLAGNLKFVQGNTEMEKHGFTRRGDGKTALQTYYHLDKAAYQLDPNFKIKFSSSEPAYLYAFRFDSTQNQVQMLYPLNAAPYSTFSACKDQEIDIPLNFSLDNTGTDYFCLFFSKSKINLSDFSVLPKQTGSFLERLDKTFGYKMVEDPIKYAAFETKFGTSNITETKDTVPIIVKID